MRANKSSGFLEFEAHELMHINCKLMILNEIGINWKLLEPGPILIALDFDPRITYKNVERAELFIISKIKNLCFFLRLSF